MIKVRGMDAEPEMTPVKPLPSFLAQRFRAWRATTYAENQAWYRRLVEDGQRPRAMVIACCDSRVEVASIFGAETGDFFIHRNIANLVPPYEPNRDRHGTSAAIEYAVTVLKIANLMVLGHAGCGGVHGCHAMCAGQAPELEAETSFIGRWMDILRPGYARLDKTTPEADQREALGRLGVVVSLENLSGFPFVAEAAAEGRLALHGAYLDMGGGGLEAFEPADGLFHPVL